VQPYPTRAQARRFRGPLGGRLLQRRGGLIVRRLALRLGGRAVFGGLSAILEAERDLPFAAALVQALNLILLTAPEARPPGPTPYQDRVWSGLHPKDDLLCAAALVQALNLTCSPRPRRARLADLVPQGRVRVRVRVSPLMMTCPVRPRSC
jgi:hypothetical protein